MQRRQFITRATAVAAAVPGVLGVPLARAQTGAYPNKPLRMVVPFAAGVSPDVVARVFAEKLTQALGQTVIVDNRPGAGGIIGAEAAASAADGYNLFFSVKAVMAIAPHVFPKAGFNAIDDLRPLSQVLTLPHIITAAPAAPFNNLQQLVQ
ncbi:MAG: tripartite tricarboxylate transporter substrate binding protein, partial [Chitinophagaceae bacterium]|nr:tripartite tricarboxylate transporter substrate binding protein [Rubrivivax sp.]